MLHVSLEGIPEAAMRPPLSDTVLCEENQRFAGSGGVSQDNWRCGFVAAFYDTSSGHAEVSRFRNGRPAPIHLLDGIPEEWVVARDPSGRVIAVKESIIAGFIFQGRFYTREQTVKAMGQGIGRSTSNRT